MRDVFVGRDTVVDALERALAGSFALVSGEPGIGKTRVAEEVARRFTAKGHAVAWGRSWEAEGTPALWPWLSVLRELDIAVPELSSALAGSDVQFSVFDATARALREAARARPILVVLDDLHAADLASLRFLAFVARQLRGGDAGIAILATTRDPARHASPRAADLIAGATRDAALHVPLAPLVREDIERWLAARASPMDANALLSASDGVPLFVHELLAGGATDGRTLGMRAAIGAHLAIASERAVEIAGIASVLGRDPPRAALTALADRSLDDLRAALADASAAGILSEDGAADPSAEGGGAPRSGAERLRFSHVLVRDELYARLDVARRAELHRRAAVFFVGDPSVAAHHWLAGARAEDADIVARTVLAAMTNAVSRFAFEDAVALGERAGAILGPALSRADATAIGIAIADAKMLSGESDAARVIALEAAKAARELGDAEKLARAALVFAYEPTFARRDEHRIGLLRDALAGLGHGDSPLRAQVMARLASALVPTVGPLLEEALELGRDSVAMARRTGDDAALLVALFNATTGLPEIYDARLRLALNGEAIALAEKLHATARIFPLLGWQVASSLECGDVDGAHIEAGRADRLIGESAHPAHAWRPHLIHGVLAALDGRFADAIALSNRARALADEARAFHGFIFWITQRMCFPYIRGDADGLAELETHFGPMAQTPSFAVFRSLFDAPMGRVERVRASLDKAIEIDLRAQPGAGVLGWPAVLCDVREHAKRFYDIVIDDLTRSPLVLGPGGTTMTGPRALLAGRLALLLDDDATALDHLRASLAYSQKIRSRPFIAQSELWIADTLAKRGDPSATVHAENALAIATELGMRGVTEHARSFVKSTPKTPRSQPPVHRALEVSREGETWTVAEGERRVVLKDTKGLAYLDALVRDPHREVHVLELVGIDERGDAGPLLDEKAKKEYRARAEALRDEIEEAERFGDPTRARKKRDELDALAAELARAVGLGGRDRRAASNAERARINVQRRLKDVIRRVGEQDSFLGRHLDASVKTGVFCTYAPTWPGS